MPVELREITADSVRAVIALSVAPAQRGFVAPNATSLAQALFSPEAWVRAIHADGELVGFVMLYDESLRAAPPAAPEVGLWRLMIDARYQRRGHGAAALALVIAHVRAEARFTALQVSYVPGPGCPEGFYLRAGFTHTGRLDDDEIVLELPLAVAAQALQLGTPGGAGQGGAMPVDELTDASLQGGCDCGQVRYRLRSRPLFVNCCHCRWCQRESGSAFALNAMIESERVELLAGQPERVLTPSASGKGQTILRCPSCRVALWSHYAGAGERVAFVRVGTQDDPDRLPPDIHIFSSTRQPWLELPPGVPAVAGYYDRRQYWPAGSLERWQALLSQGERGASA